MANTVEIQWYNLALTGTSSCLSILGCLVIFVTYVKIENIRNFTRTLLLYLTIADLLTAVGNLVATVRYTLVYKGDENADIRKRNCTGQDSIMPKENSTLVGVMNLELYQNEVSSVYEGICRYQSFVTTFSNLSSFLWTTIIAFHIWFSIMTTSRRTEMTCSHVIFCVIGWVIPISVVIPLFVKDYLGEDTCFGTGVWCGIKFGLSRNTVRKVMFIADIGWQLSCYLLTTFFCVTIKFNIWVKRRYNNIQDLRDISDNLRKEDKHFIKIVLIIISLKAWGIIRFFITAYTAESTLENSETLSKVLWVFLLLQSYGASGQGFWNFVLFCVADEFVRKELKAMVLCKRTDETLSLGEEWASNRLKNACETDNEI